MQELHENLKIAEKYADVNTQHAQQQYAARYNKRAKEKQFSLNDKVLILQPDNTKSRVFSKWKGPAVIVEVKSPHSYVVDLDGVKYRMHANQLRHYHVRTDEVTFDNRVFDDVDKSNSVVVNFTQFEEGENYDGLCEMFEICSDNHIFRTSTCVREEDTDFGDLQPCELQPTGHTVRSEVKDI